MLISLIIITITDLILLLVPLFKGSVSTFSKNVMISASYIIILIWLISIIVKRSHITLNLIKLSPILLFILISIIQITPVPDMILKLLSHKSFYFWESSRTLLNDLSGYYTRNYFTVSIYPQATFSSLMLLVSYVLYGIFIAKYFITKEKIILLLIPVIILTAIESLIGFYQSFAIYGISGNEGAHGTFINKNHFSGFLELCTPLVIALIFYFNKNLFTGRKSLLDGLLKSDELTRRLIVLIFVPFFFLAIFMSKSRMGIVSIILSMLFFYFNLVNRERKFNHIKYPLYFIILFFIFISAYIGIGPLIERFTHTDYGQRVLVWKDCINIIRDFPLLGTGLGTFEHIYPLYKFNVKSAIDYNFAHNDYLQLLIETGVLGFSCIATAIVIFIRDVFHFLSTRSIKNEGFKYFITLGAFTGILSILIHSIADFNLHIPANAIYFTTFIGIIYAVNSGEYELLGHGTGTYRARGHKKSHIRN